MLSVCGPCAVCLRLIAFCAARRVIHPLVKAPNPKTPNPKAPNPEAQNPKPINPKRLEAGEKASSLNPEVNQLRAQSRPYSLFPGLGSLKTSFKPKGGTLFIPRFLLGLATNLCQYDVLRVRGGFMGSKGFGTFCFWGLQGRVYRQDVTQRAGSLRFRVLGA